MFLIGRRLTPDLPGLPTLLYVSMLLPFLATNVVTTDVLLAMFVTAGAAALIGPLPSLGADSAQVPHHGPLDRVGGGPSRGGSPGPVRSALS